MRTLIGRPLAYRAPGRRDSGAALILAILTLFILTAFGLALLFNTTTEFQIAGAETTVNRAFYAADSGVQYGIIQGQGVATGPCTAQANYWCFQVPEMNTNATSGAFTMKTMNVSVTPMRLVDFQKCLLCSLGKGGVSLYNVEKHFESISQDSTVLNTQKRIAVDFSVGPIPLPE